MVNRLFVGHPNGSSLSQHVNMVFLNHQNLCSCKNQKRLVSAQTWEEKAPATTAGRTALRKGQVAKSWTVLETAGPGEANMPAVSAWELSQKGACSVQLRIHSISQWSVLLEAHTLVLIQLFAFHQLRPQAFNLEVIVGKNKVGEQRPQNNFRNLLLFASIMGFLYIDLPLHFMLN